MAPKKDTAADRDECVAYAVECLWENVDQHMKDKFIFPKIVSHAVARTLAAMVHMVSVSIVQKLENWDSHVEGRVSDEWLSPKEMVLPPLDTWARGVVPVKPPELPPDPVITSARESPRPRRSTVTSIPSLEYFPTAREVFDRKGSPRRRFSDGHPVPPELIKKFKPPEPKPEAPKKKKKSQIDRNSQMDPRKSQMDARKSQMEARRQSQMKASPSDARKPSNAGK